MADFFDQNPYLRRFQVPPEQQRAYDRYVLSVMRQGAGAAGDGPGLSIQPLTAAPAPDAGGMATPAADMQPSAAPSAVPAVPLARPDGTAVSAPPAPVPSSLPAPLPVGAMQPNGFPVHPNPNAPTNMPVSPARMQPGQDVDSRSLGRRSLDGLSTDINWLETRAIKLLGGIAGIPRETVEGAEALGRYLGAPPTGLLGGLSASKNYLPTAEEAANFSRRGFGILPYVPPDVNLPGPLGTLVDKGVEGALGTLLTGGTNLARGALVGAGSEAAAQAARGYDRKRGTNTEQPVRLFGDIYGLVP